MVNFMHIRECDEIGIIKATGGMTVAYTWNEDIGGIFIQCAFCHPRDQFSRKVGRELAALRLKEEGPYDVLTFEHPIAETIRKWLTNYFGYEILPIESTKKGGWMSTFISYSD